MADLYDAITKVRAGYESQMKFCDIEALGYFREFVRRINEALASVDTHPQGGDAVAAPFMSGAVPAEEQADAQPSSASPNPSQLSNTDTPAGVEAPEPCPFCGGRASPMRARGWSVACDGGVHECDIAPETTEFATRAEAITAWNTRTLSTRVAELEADKARLVEAEGLTYALQHNPNCPKPYLVRLPRGVLDYDAPDQTSDALGYGMTFGEAFNAALSTLSTGGNNDR